MTNVNLPITAEIAPRADRGHERQTGYVVLYAYQVIEVMLHKQDKLSGS
jgi:hypothetical protein